MVKKVKKHLKIVSFDEEVITKGSADKLYKSAEKNKIDKFHKPNTYSENEPKRPKISGNNLNELHEVNISKIRRNKRKRDKARDQERKVNKKNGEHEEELKKKLEVNKKRDRNHEVTSEIGNEDIEREQKEVKPKKKKKLKAVETSEEPELTDELSVENPKVKTGESIRAQKRKKYLKLLEDKRLNAELTIQQNTLNYLSKWKHCRTEWKFEKLKQIWLQQNLFDTCKIPNEFWEIVVEYFSNSKGLIRNAIVTNALKIIEKEENAEGENTDENSLVILQRAREIIQNLQE